MPGISPTPTTVNAMIHPHRSLRKRLQGIHYLVRELRDVIQTGVVPEEYFIAASVDLNQVHERLAELIERLHAERDAEEKL